MRFIVFILSIIGCITAGGVAFIWFNVLLEPDLEGRLADARTLIKIAERSKHSPASKEKIQEARERLTMVDCISVAAYLMLAALPLGLAGGVIGLKRRGLIAALLMLLAVPGPILFVLLGPGGAPPAILYVAIASVAPFLLGGLLAFLIKRKLPVYVDEPVAPARRRGAVLADE